MILVRIGRKPDGTIVMRMVPITDSKYIENAMYTLEMDTAFKDCEKLTALEEMKLLNER